MIGKEMLSSSVQKTTQQLPDSNQIRFEVSSLIDKKADKSGLLSSSNGQSKSPERKQDTPGTPGKWILDSPKNNNTKITFSNTDSKLSRTYSTEKSPMSLARSSKHRSQRISLKVNEKRSSLSFGQYLDK